MSEFPFSDSEWAALQELSLKLTNAQLQDDEILRRSFFLELQELLHTYRDRYGLHPVLLETEADFSEDASARVDLYQQALTVAQTNGLPTGAICVSLARVILEDYNSPTGARKILLGCKDEVAKEADESVAMEWSQLLMECDRG